MGGGGSAGPAGPAGGAWVGGVGGVSGVSGSAVGGCVLAELPRCHTRRSFAHRCPLMLAAMLTRHPVPCARAACYTAGLAPVVPSPEAGCPAVRPAVRIRKQSLLQAMEDAGVPTHPEKRQKVTAHGSPQMSPGAGSVTSSVTSSPQIGSPQIGSATSSPQMLPSADDYSPSQSESVIFDSVRSTKSHPAYRPLFSPEASVNKSPTPGPEATPVASK